MCWFPRGIEAERTRRVLATLKFTLGLGCGPTVAVRCQSREWLSYLQPIMRRASGQAVPALTVFSGGGTLPCPWPGRSRLFLQGCFDERDF